MKLLPICINCNINYMVDFESKRIIDSFVIAADNEGVLLTLTAIDNRFAQQKCILFQETDDKKYYYVKSIESPFDQDGSAVNITINFTDDQNTVLNNTIDKRFSFDSDTMTIKHPIVNDAITVNVNFKFGDFERPIKIYLAPSGQIRDAVIDSGSEATQLAIFKRTGETHNVNLIQPIFTNVFSHFKEYTDDIAFRKYANMCIQAEVDGNNLNEKLFKSQFFVKKEITDDEISLATIMSEAGQDEVPSSTFRMLTHIDELNDINKSHIQLCNMKISSFGGIPLPGIRINNVFHSLGEISPKNYFYRKYMNVFIHGILNKFCGQMEQGNIEEETNKAKILSLYLLMPNVYSFEDIQGHIDNLTSDVDTMIQSNDRFKECIKGFSIVPVSESDASLIGAMSMQNQMGGNNGTYLIIDAGKGTLDFSITEIDTNGNFHNLIKNGIVGASAAISYGFMLDLLNEFARVKEIKVSKRDFIYSNVLGMTDDGKELGGGDMYLLNRLMKAIDFYKIRYNNLDDYKPEEIPLTHDNNGIRLETFVDWIEGCSMKIPVSNVNAIIDMITEYFCTKLTSSENINNVDYVVFSGRGFLYSDFKNKMFEKLQKVNSNINEKEFIRNAPGSTYKNICLFITSTISSGRYNFQYMPKPYEVDKKYINGLIEIQNRNRVNPNQNIIQNITKGLLSLSEQFTNFGDKFIITGNNANDAANTSTNPFADGYAVKCSSNAVVAIGGSFYSLPADCSQNVTEAYLFYNNGKIYIRYQNTQGMIQVSTLSKVSNLDTGLAFPSLFPYNLISNSDEIFIPRIKETEVQEQDYETEAETETPRNDTLTTEQTIEDKVIEENKTDNQDDDLDFFFINKNN